MPVLLWMLAAAALAEDRTASGAAARARRLAERLVAEVGPRPARTEAAERAQVWVEAELRARGWEPRRVPGGVPEGTVLACRAGPGDTLLALAHTDSVHADVPGANDNAAGVAVLLVVAEDLGEPPRTVCLAFPGGEEIGLRGSAALAAAEIPELARLDRVVALDLVGRGTPTWNGLGPAWGTHRLRALLAVAPLDVPWVYRAVSHAMPAMERSDHLPFARRGAPALHLMGRAESGVYLAYHTRDDRPDQLEEATLEAAVGAVLALAADDPLPEDVLGDPAVVLPGAIVIPGGLARGMAVSAGLIGAFGAVSRAPWRAELAGWAKLAALSISASLAAILAVAVVGAGRDLGMALTGPAACVGWFAWAGVALAWPWRAPAATGRRFAALGIAAWATALTAMGAFLLAWPSWLLLATVGLSAAVGPTGARRALGLAAAGLSLAVAGYFLRADTLRELAFHEMLPASASPWGALWLILASPSLGLLQGRALPRGARVVGLALLIAAAALAAGSRALDPYSAPFVSREELSAW